MGIRAYMAAALVAIAVFVKTQPVILLKVPNIGFILYAIIGGVPPPPYMTKECFEHFDEFVRPGDVIIAAGAKMGTTMTLNAVHQVCY